MAKISNESVYPKKHPLNPQTTWVGTDPATGKTITVEASSLLGQLFNLDALGQACITYPTTTFTDCETGQEIEAPLQIVQVLLQHETLICQLLQNPSQAEYTLSPISGTNEVSLLKDGTAVSTIDLTPYLDDTNLARLISGNLNGTTGILTVTRDDSSTFTIDLSALLAMGASNESGVALENDYDNLGVTDSQTQEDFNMAIHKYVPVVKSSTKASPEYLEFPLGTSFEWHPNYAIAIVEKFVGQIGGRDLYEFHLQGMIRNDSGANLGVSSAGTQAMYLNGIEVYTGSSAGNTNDAVSGTIHRTSAFADIFLTYNLFWNAFNSRSVFVLNHGAKAAGTGNNIESNIVFEANQELSLNIKFLGFFSNGGGGVNQPPVANAGADQTITLPTSSVNLSGSASNDPDGTITSYQWSFVGLSSGTIVSPTSSNTTVTGLVAGTHTLQLQVTDNNGATDTDTVVITVNAAVASTQVEVGQGDCNTTPLTWDTVYLAGTNTNTVTAGDIVYTDAALTTVYDGGFNLFRLRVGGALITNQLFRINNLGVVGQVTDCNGGGGGFDLTPFTPVTSNSCESYQCVQVTVPSGQTRTVTITKTGIAGYSGTQGCSQADQTVVSNMTETISQTKIYSIGIDAATGNQGATTQITVSVQGGNALVLSRTHSSPVQNC